MNNIEIIDNFLSQEDFLNIRNTFFPQDLNNPNNFVWTYQKGIVRDPESGPTGYEEHDWIYVHPLYSSDNGLKYDKYYSLVKTIVDKLKVKKLFDIRANLLVPTLEHIYHEFHTDRKVPHQVALFYATSCNGFTVLKDTAKVECIENRMLIFDGSIKHHSVTSTDYPRSIININYVPNT
jgi:hypothetical protein